MSEPPKEPWTVLRLLNWTKQYLAQAEVDSARLSAEVLLAHALDCPRVMLYARHDYQPTDEQLTAFREHVRRAAAHEPVAYLVGRKEFYSLTFKVTPDVLVPRPETEILVAEAVAHLRPLGRDVTVWDACTGCGCVGIAVAHQVAAARVLATDICPAALAVADENVSAHDLADRVRTREADLLTLPDDCADLAPFDVVTANPPYIADGYPLGETVRHEPPAALYGGPDGMDFLPRLIRQAPPLLREGGKLILEFGYDQASAVRDAVVADGQFDEPRIRRDHQHIERALVATRRKAHNGPNTDD